MEQQLALLGGVARHMCAQTCAAKSTYVYVRARLQLLRGKAPNYSDPPGSGTLFSTITNKSSGTLVHL